MEPYSIFFTALVKMKPFLKPRFHGRHI